MPSVVVEIVLGIIIGPSVLGWAEPDQVVKTLSVVGLAFLLFLAGLELDLTRLRGRTLRLDEHRVRRSAWRWPLRAGSGWHRPGS